jgi:hypothetical protein
MTRRRVDGSSPASAVGAGLSGPGPDARLAVYGSLAPGRKTAP